MPRPHFFPNSTYPYHVYARCLNKDWFELPLETVWDITTTHLHFMSAAFNAWIHSFVLMQNHFHLLITTPDANLSEMMRFFMKATSDSIAEITGRINPMWGSRYNRTLITKDHYFNNVYKYVYRNPVEAGIVDKVEVYPFSTLNGLLGFRHLMVPIVEDKLLFGDTEATLEWLNTPAQKQNWMTIKKALKRKVFKLGRSPDRKTPCVLEHLLL